MTKPDAMDRAIIVASQSGLPLTGRPFAALAEMAGLGEDDLLTRMRAMRESGAIRRIAAVPNHYALGLTANGMSVWDVDDDAIGKLGPLVGALDFVTHCYRRPRRRGLWPYNLFAMVHGRDREEVFAKAKTIETLLGPACRGRDILFSTRILKKTGFRLSA